MKVYLFLLTSLSAGNTFDLNNVLSVFWRNSTADTGPAMEERFRRSSGVNGQNLSCCYTGTCACPQAYPMPIPMYPVFQPPVVIPARTYFEPVVHDHPPVRELISRSDSEYSDISDDSDDSIDYGHGIRGRHEIGTSKRHKYRYYIAPKKDRKHGRFE